MVPIKLGDLGEGTKEATVKDWFKKIGDTVQEEDEVVEVITDKLVAQIPSPVTGVLKKISYQIDEVCPVGHILCEIEEEGEEEKEEPSKPQASESILPPDYDKILATPAVRHLLRTHKISHTKVKGTGKKGRIMKEDVLRYIETTNQEIPVDSSPIINIDKNSDKETKEIDGTIVKVKGFHKAMVSSMTEAAKIPQLLYSDEFNVEKLTTLRKTLNEESNIKITMTSLLMKAISLSLSEFPILNSRVIQPLPGKELEEYEMRTSHNISLAIDSVHGLIVPNIKNVQNKTIRQIQLEVNTLREQVEKNKLKRASLEDGTIAVSNIGNLGGKVVKPIIMPPQVCIIGIGRTFDSIQMSSESEGGNFIPFAHNPSQGVRVQKAIPICISADHRIIEGSTVARFSEHLRSLIEHPLNILI